jgi:hypothetical protein
MSSKEIAGEEFDKQRLALPNSADLIYFMTIHHHCDCSAFQSGGDSSNEERPGGSAHETGQDGLHITMGNMEHARHDIDVRFYLKGAKVIPNMAAFWDIGKAVSGLIPPDMHGAIAKYQMCEKVEIAFPDQWKSNYIKPEPVASTRTTYHYQGGMGYGCGWQGNGEKTLSQRIDDSSWELVDDLVTKSQLDTTDINRSLDFLQESTVLGEILIEAMKCRYDAIDIRSLIKKMVEDMGDYIESTLEAERMEEEAALQGKIIRVDRSVKRGKTKRNRNNGQDKSTTVPSGTTTEYKHGEVSTNGHFQWDADSRAWVQRTEAGEVTPSAYD